MQSACERRLIFNKSRVLGVQQKIQRSKMIAFLMKTPNQERWFVSKEEAKAWGDQRNDPRDQTVVEEYVITTSKDIVDLLNIMEGYRRESRRV